MTKAEQDARENLADYARNAAGRTIFQAVRNAGGQLIDRPVSIRHPDWGTLKDASAADGLVAARAIELAAHGKVRDYIRAAREDGLSWRKIGELLNLQAEAKALEVPVADLAFDVAAGPRDSDYSWRERSFSWRCRDCGELLGDFGPDVYPEPERGGHKSGCRRLAVERRAYSLYCKERGW